MLTFKNWIVDVNMNIVFLQTALNTYIYSFVSFFRITAV